MKFTQEHEALRRTTRAFVEKEINPYVKEWEENGPFPAHELFKKMGDLGLLGICKPVEYGGMGLDYSYNMVVADELGRAGCGGVHWPLAYKQIWQLLPLHVLAPTNSSKNFWFLRLPAIM
jgi:alkylation response protein AidB-like acyl-CoA dehydrogenase